MGRWVVCSYTACTVGLTQRYARLAVQKDSGPAYAESMGASSKRKGNRGEAEWAALLNAELGTTCLRVPFSGAAPQFGRGDVSGLSGWCQEVKRVEALNVHAAFAQAQASCGLGERPLLAFRRNREGWRVMLDAADFFDLLRAAGLADPEA